MKTKRISTIFATILATLIVCAVFAGSFFGIYTIIMGICLIYNKIIPDGVLLVSFFLALGVTIVTLISYCHENN